MADQPTRRLGQFPDAQPCPKCAAARVWTATQTYGGMPVRLVQRIGKNLMGLPKEGRTACRALTCLTCGYTELYTRKPEALRDLS